MPRTSKIKLEKEVFVKIQNRFVGTVFGLKNKKEVDSFFNDFFTIGEKVMLAKRLAIIFMLYEGISFYRIHKILKVSTSTVKRLSDKIDRGDLETINDIVRKKKNREIFWAEMEVMLSFRMPSYVGKDRWKFLDDLYGKYNLK